MRPRRQPLSDRTVGKKQWVTFGLQSLTTERFARVVDGILKGEQILLRDRLKPDR
jgi:hypothetical protein